MLTMPKITTTLGEPTYRAARSVADERNTTLSALVHVYVQTLVPPKTPANAARTQALFAALDKAQGFSAANRLTRGQAAGVEAS